MRRRTTANEMAAEKRGARMSTRKHNYWAAGEADCPREIKAPNGELHTLKCKNCDDPKAAVCTRQTHQVKGISVDVRKCQRCGEDHDRVEFRPLFNPADEFTYYGQCPNVTQPILLAIRKKLTDE